MLRMGGTPWFRKLSITMAVYAYAWVCTYHYKQETLISEVCPVRFVFLEKRYQRRMTFPYVLDKQLFMLQSQQNARVSKATPKVILSVHFLVPLH